MTNKTKRKNLFRFSKETRNFSIIKKISDLSSYPYILKFIYRDNQQEFFLMHSDFKTQLNKGRIIFTEQ